MVQKTEGHLVIVVVEGGLALIARVQADLMRD